MNYYLILGINSEATGYEIKEAYRKKVQKYHPDHYGKDSAPFLQIQEAYQILSDPVRRKIYDKKLSQSRPVVHNVKSKPLRKYAQQPEPLIPPEKSNRIENISLLRYGIENFYLTVIIIVSNKA